MTAEARRCVESVLADPCADLATLMVAADAAEETEDTPSVEAVLMRWIIAAPDDDGPRLRLASRWDGHGQRDRGEFVRLQCRLAEWEKDVAAPKNGMERLGYMMGYHKEFAVINAVTGLDRPCDCETCLVKRERELLDNNTFADFPAWVNQWWFRRGFVERIEATAADFLAHADAIRRQTPLRKVALTTWPEFAGHTAIREIQVRIVLGARFPGIEFEFPSSGYAAADFAPLFEDNAGFTEESPFVKDST